MRMGSGTLIVLGAKGQLGRELVQQSPAAGVQHVIGYGSSDLDVTDAEALSHVLIETRPAWVINCAALTNVDACEKDPDRTMQVNARPAGVLADICNRIGAMLVQLSTDFVFDGQSRQPYREDDPTGPLNVYAQAKLLAEEYTRECRHHLIVRTAWLFGPGTNNFVARMLGRMMAGQPLRIVDDRVGNPTYSRDLASAILRLLQADATGVYHVVNQGKASWYELAKTAAEFADLQASIEPIDSSQYPCPADRPADSSLDTTRYEAATGNKMRHWREALKDYVEAGTWRP